MHEEENNIYSHIEIDGTDYIDLTGTSYNDTYIDLPVKQHADVTGMSNDTSNVTGAELYDDSSYVDSDEQLYDDSFYDDTDEQLYNDSSYGDTDEQLYDDSSYGDTDEESYDESDQVRKKIDSTRYPNINKVNTKAIILGSLACILLIFILSVMFPSNPNDTASPDSSSEATTEATTELKTGWQIIDNKKVYIEDDGSVAVNKKIDNFYVGNDGTILTNQWIDNYFLGEDGKPLTNTLTPDGTYVGYDGKKDLSMGTIACTQGLNDLREELESMISDYSGTWSVYVKDLSHAEYLSINNVQHFSASMIKIYCAAAAYDRIANGELEETESVDRLMRDMISVSDNDAFNLMVRECATNKDAVTGCGNIQQYIINEGYKDTTISTMLVPTKYPFPNSPGRNYTTVEDCGMLMEKVYKRKVGNPELSDAFLELLLNQTHTNKIPSGLPAGTKCANKTGDNDDVQHDAAIVYSPGGDYIIAVMSSDCGAAIGNIQDISRVVYEYFN